MNSNSNNNNICINSSTTTAVSPQIPLFIQRWILEYIWCLKWDDSHHYVYDMKECCELALVCRDWFTACSLLFNRNVRSNIHATISRRRTFAPHREDFDVYKAHMSNPYCLMKSIGKLIFEGQPFFPVYSNTGNMNIINIGNNNNNNDQPPTNIYTSQQPLMPNYYSNNIFQLQTPQPANSNYNLYSDNSKFNKFVMELEFGMQKAIEDSANAGIPFALMEFPRNSIISQVFDTVEDIGMSISNVRLDVIPALKLLLEVKKKRPDRSLHIRQLSSGSENNVELLDVFGDELAHFTYLTINVCGISPSQLAKCTSLTGIDIKNSLDSESGGYFDQLPKEKYLSKVEDLVRSIPPLSIKMLHLCTVDKYPLHLLPRFPNLKIIRGCQYSSELMDYLSGKQTITQMYSSPLTIEPNTGLDRFCMMVKENKTVDSYNLAISSVGDDPERTIPFNSCVTKLKLSINCPVNISNLKPHLKSLHISIPPRALSDEVGEQYITNIVRLINGNTVLSHLTIQEIGRYNISGYEPIFIAIRELGDKSPIVSLSVNISKQRLKGNLPVTIPFTVAQILQLIGPYYDCLFKDNGLVLSIFCTYKLFQKINNI